jgi:phosphoglycerate kinase
VKPPDLADLVPKLVAYANGMRELANVHVNEGFAASNRDLSSTIVPAVMEHNALGAYIGNELRTHLRECRKAEVVVFSGMKLEKLDDLQAIINRGQTRDVIAAGLLAVALLKADAELAKKPFEMGMYGDSSHKLYIGPEWVEKCKAMLTKARANGVEFTLPVDFILASGGSSDTIPQGGAQLDVGPKTVTRHQQKCTEFIARHQERVGQGRPPVVVFHNGVFGKFEEERFAQGTIKFLSELKRMTEAGLKTYVGGGEGGAALRNHGDENWVTHCFTAGGTILKALGTEPIPYIKALTMAAQR